MAELIVWRHGRTDYNAAGRIQGRVDIPLNADGLAQAAAVARSVAELQPTAIVSSPLTRARQTAAALARVTGLDVATDDALTERAFGLWEGLDGRAIEASWPEQYGAWRAGGDPAGVGVETRAETSARVGECLARLSRSAGGGRVVVVAHGAALTLGTTHLLGLDPSGWFGLRGMDNCHYAVLRDSVRPPGWMLAGWNLAGSLTIAAGTAGGLPEGRGPWEEPVRGSARPGDLPENAATS